MAHGDDTAADEIFAAIGKMGDWTPWGDWVVGAIYHPPATSKGGIIMVSESTARATQGAKGLSTAASHRLEGKAFLLLASGPAAFPEKAMHWYPDGRAPRPGDWFFALPNTGIEISLQFPGAIASDRTDGKPWPCRLFLAKDLMGPLPNPSVLI
jgi:hypothetical protein